MHHSLRFKNTKKVFITETDEIKISSKKNPRVAYKIENGNLLGIHAGNAFGGLPEREERIREGGGAARAIGERRVVVVAIAVGV